MCSKFCITVTLPSRPDNYHCLKYFYSDYSFNTKKGKMIIIQGKCTVMVYVCFFFSPSTVSKCKGKFSLDWNVKTSEEMERILALNGQKEHINYRE